MAYFIAGATSFWAYQKVKRSHDLRDVNTTRGRLWAILGFVTIALGFNKQLDLQRIIPKLGRFVLRLFNLGGYQRLVQLVIIGLLIVLIIAFFLRLWANFRNFAKTQVIAITGITLVFLFIIGRAATFHKVDVALGLNVQSAFANAIIELGGIICIVVSSCFAAIFPSKINIASKESRSRSHH